MRKIAVLGAGGWGTTLALLLHGNGHSVRLWEFFPERVEELHRARENVLFLPGVMIPQEIAITNHLAEALEGAGIIVFAVPSHVLRNVAKLACPHLLETMISVNVAKGLEEKTLKRMSEVLKDELPWGAKIATLSGPSHAEEVSRGIPTAVTVASRQESLNKQIQRIFMSPHFRVYTNADIVGVELAGSVKNVVAIAAGICDGLKYGDNTKGALLTRGLAEISRLGIAMGARAQTFSGLSGMGDLITTCVSKHSRNRYVGEQIGRGKKLNQILSEMEMVAEGVNTTKSARLLAKAKGVEMPITEQVYQVLFTDKDPRKAVNDLMNRGAKAEIWW
jgi:glycerol-3-phosphate dehydrogenase (NAD(P)+)